MLNEQYNFNYRRIITVSEGEEICPKCKGKGRVQYSKSKQNTFIIGKTLCCNKCLGEGKIDWIEKATGKKVKNE